MEAGATSHHSAPAISLSPRGKLVPSRPVLRPTDYQSGFDLSLKRNREATEQMQAGNYIAALRLLHIAENFPSFGTLREQQLLKVIFNNLGCCYMQSQQWPKAARYLGNALALETETQRTASIMVNLSTVSYQTKDYQQALGQAMKAIHVLEGKDRSVKENRTYVKAFNCAAMAYEAVGNRRMALLHYYRGVGVASETLGPTHDLTRSMQDRYKALGPSKDTSRPSARDAAVLRTESSALFTPLPRPRRSFLTRKAAPLPLISPKVLSSTPRLEARRPSPNYSSTTASSKDLGLPLAPRQMKKLKNMRIRANSEKQSGILAKSRTESSDVETRLHSIDEKLMNLSQRLNEYEWKNRELRQIAEKDGKVWSELFTPVEESVDRSDLRELESAVTIQRHIRGFLARRRFAPMLKPASEIHPASRRPKKALGSSGKSRVPLLRYAMYNEH